jgi:hypothetical protein
MNPSLSCGDPRRISDGSAWVCTPGAWVCTQELGILNGESVPR